MTTANIVLEQKQNKKHKKQGGVRAMDRIVTGLVLMCFVGKAGVSLLE
ncbi:MAG: hypothetical protein IJ679_09025 [Lachnospiraceae bacterium]|nr:hypothetical protein [Lachnospiraceae bacterium]